MSFVVRELYLIKAVQEIFMYKLQFRSISVSGGLALALRLLFKIP